MYKRQGLYNTFMENFPITDTRNQFVLEFLDYFVDPPRYTIQAVSYTHLDVYKRQVSYMQVLEEFLSKLIKL